MDGRQLEVRIRLHEMLTRLLGHDIAARQRHNQTITHQAPKVHNISITIDSEVIWRGILFLYLRADGGERVFILSIDAWQTSIGFSNEFAFKLQRSNHDMTLIRSQLYAHCAVMVLNNRVLLIHSYIIVPTPCSQLEVSILKICKNVSF